MWVTLLFVPLILAAAHGCGEVSPRAEVVCYYSSQEPSSHLDPCKCTILVDSNTGLDSSLRLTSPTDFSELHALKKTNPGLKVVASVGGRNVKTETFSLLTASVEGMANFTEGAAAFVAQNKLDGIEVDWRWPGHNGGAKEREDFTTLMKVLRLVLDQRVHSVSRRSAAGKEEEEKDEVVADSTTTTEIPADDQETQTETTEATTEVTSEDIVDVEVTTTLPGLEEEASLGSDYLVLESGSEYEVTLRPTQSEVRFRVKGNTMKEREERKGNTKSTKRPFRGRVKFRDYFNVDGLITTTTTTTTSTTTTSSTTASPLSTTVPSNATGWKIAKSSQTKADDEDVATQRSPLSVAEPQLTRRKIPDTILMMTVAPCPEYIVKGYNLKELAKIVDLFSLPTHNLTEEHRPEDKIETFHHSRLMGVSDLQNADSLVDLVVSLGVPLDRLVIGIPVTAAVFTLRDPEFNTPRSPALDLPVFTPYKQACTMMETGNWTVERDEDLTGPYAFLNDTWMAFDDPTSTKIKVGEGDLLADDHRQNQTCLRLVRKTTLKT